MWESTEECFDWFDGCAEWLGVALLIAALFCLGGAVISLASALMGYEVVTSLFRS